MCTRYFLMLAATGFALAAAQAADLPTRKPGLWEITMKIENSKLPPSVQRVCLDAATDQLLYKVGAGASQKMCSRVDIRNTGGRVAVESECQIAGSKVTSHSITTMSGDSAYHTDVSVHYEPALYGRSDSNATHDAKWIGACPSDMRAGDVVVAPSSMMPAAIKMNLNDMFKGGQ